MTRARSVENNSDSCRNGVFNTGQDSSKTIPIICASPSRKYSVSKADGACRRCKAALATSNSGEITTSIGI